MVSVLKLLDVMQPVHGFQEPVIECLETDAETVNARRAPAGGFIKRDAFRIGFERHLSVQTQIEMRSYRIDNLGNMMRVQEGRRAAAEKNRSYRHPRMPLSGVHGSPAKTRGG